MGASLGSTGVNMIGNIEEARFIREWCYENDHWESPKGWRRLGSGCYRTAYLSPSGVVYKVERCSNSYQTNEGEAGALRRYMFRKFPQGCRLPRYQLFTFDEHEGVMAMEHLPRLLRQVSRHDEEGAKIRALRARLVEALADTDDMHDDNIGITADGVLVPIDLGG